MSNERMEELVARFDANYEWLYENRGNSYADGMEYAAACDYDSHRDDRGFIAILREFAERRRDVVCSDREAAAFMLACRTMGIA